MAGGNNRIADPVDTVQHLMDRAVRSNRVYKFVWSPALEQLVLEKESASQSTQ